ncbi:MAG TPA: amino acid ABC transporter permease [Candidatus Limnocylindria bacterium]|nr:amino acid ABC transporter permease [Candidatus Limnocylindria bacterium]
MTVEQLAPPQVSTGRVAWLRENLFSGWANSLVTIVLGGSLILFAVLLADWAVNQARWGVITANLRLFLMGFYPLDQAWRVWLTLALFSSLAGLSAGRSRLGPVRTLVIWFGVSQALLAGLAAVAALEAISIPGRLGQFEEMVAVTVAFLANAAIVFAVYWLSLRIQTPRWLLPLGWLASVPMTLLLLQGIGIRGLPLVSSSTWGGLLLTFLLAIVGIVLSFPFGVLLALGRRSDLPALRWLSTAYIEVVRGVPLVTLLFMAAVMVPLFLPGGVRIEHVYRAMAGITLFSAAYVAENVRGGLQAIPSGQIEAAHAIGLSTIKTNLYIVLPQALRSVIPANVGLFISLLKDTTLVAIAGTGLLELLGIGRSVLAQTQWVGAQLEVYIFISAVFFVLCYTMSQASYRLEEALGVGKR